MPILAEETSCFPGDLFERIDETKDRRRWWSVYTKSRQEKALARQLEGMSVPFYLPLVPQVSTIRAKPVKSHLPLFSCYVFVFADDDERVQTLSTKRVTQMQCAGDQLRMTSDLLNIRALIAAGAPLTVESRLEAGRRVRVKNGALAGMEGVIVTRRGSDRLLVAMEFLQQGVSIEINDYQVEPL